MEKTELDYLYSFAKQLVCLIDQNGVFVRVSKSWERMLGWSAPEMVGKSYTDFIHPDDVHTSTTAIDDHYATKKYDKLFVNRYRKKDGSYIWLEWEGTFVEGKQLLGIARDYTYFKEREFFYNAIEETVKIGSFRANIDTGENSGSSGIFEIYDMPQAKDMNPEEGFLNFPEPGRSILIEKFKRALDHGEPYTLELPFISNKGKKKIIRCMGRPNKFNDTREVYGTMHDITEQVTKQKQLDSQRVQIINKSKMAALGEMAANIAHEINNPLSLILGKSEFIASKMDAGTATESEIKSGLLQIKKTSERIAKTVNSLRSYSRNAKGLKRTAIPLKDIIDDTLELCRERAKGLGIKVEVGEIPDVEVQTVSGQLSQVFLNLLNNSVEALENIKDAQIDVLGRVDYEKVIVSVVDNGVGVSEDVRPKLFEPFFTTKGLNGTGLGLCISETIVKEHTGQIRQLTKNRKTIFEVELPIFGNSER